MIINKPSTHSKITDENLLDDLEDSPAISIQDNTYHSPVDDNIDAWMAENARRRDAYRLNINAKDRPYPFKSLEKAWEDLLKYYEWRKDNLSSYSHTCSKDIDYVITRTSDDAECRNSISAVDFINNCGTFSDFLRFVNWDCGAPAWRD
ncbi:hypothetical protein Acife_1922 [Acidithiobacillus ferrivorans SS3]|uniref:Uncharacterized protein n=1 Tax=Acidithiobacillus ferrivorans SS3 TaxID=743299 RepID=G0JLJ6_9PROT|nr:hypothetical protein [Acidithiobacillus ferrivorans]AEM48045.1 hypothetical protein Acife_1922 [Acidithiobacillus ferrivorans SS3]